MMLNEPKKDYCEPMHSAEHILNQTMVRMFGCPRSKNAHIERRKSKCDYFLSEEPSEEIMKEIIAKIKSKEVTQKEVHDYFLARIEKFNPIIEAFNYVNENFSEQDINSPLA